MRWDLKAAFMSAMDRGDRRLALLVQPIDDEFAVLALEGDKEASPEEVLANHAHDFVGRWPTIVAAFDEAERYARAWARQRARELEQCECSAIAARNAAE
jgi:hypothetical protein